LRPRIKDSALILLKIYMGLTIIQTVLLMIAGMNLFEALCHTFGTLATGGYSTRNASIAAYDSLFIEIIITVFMIAGATSFGLHYMFITGKWREALKNSEWRFFLGILAVSSMLITFNLMGMQGVIHEGAPEAGTHVDGGFFHDLRIAIFQTVSITTNTGFATADFNIWPQFSRILLVVLMLVGGCSGSTSGGIKVVRFLILIKIVYMQILKTFQPKKIYVLRINDTVVDAEMQRVILVFFALYILVIVVATLLLSLVGLPSETAFSSVAATLNNVGPGLELVGAIENFSAIPTAGKMLLSIVMVLGRLEFMAIFVLFVPTFWKRT